MDHEIAHGLFYVNDDYKKKAFDIIIYNKLIIKKPECIFNIPSTFKNNVL